MRMFGIKRGNAKYGYSMYEFQVFGHQPQNPKPASIRLSQNTLSLLEGWSCALTATTQPSSNVYSLKWTSSDPAIVKVDNNGLVTAIGSSGTAMITVESVLDPTVKDTCEVTITPYAGRPTKVSNVKIVNEPTGLLKKGQDWSLAANVLLPPVRATEMSTGAAVIRLLLRSMQTASSMLFLPDVRSSGQPAYPLRQFSQRSRRKSAILFGLKVRKRSRLRSSWSRMARMQ